MAVAPPFPLRAAAGGDDLLLRQLFDADTGTYTYLLADVEAREGVLIDPVFEQHARDLALIEELEIDLVACLDTHAHADHITGAWLMRRATGCAIGLAAKVRASNVTKPLAEGDRVRFGGRHLEVRATPGHTDGCLTFVLDTQRLAFTGDALLIRGCGRCDFQQGNPHRLYRSITEQILSLPESCLLYPGHDYAGRCFSSVAEELAYNARLGGGADERDFVGSMENLRLPHPHRIAQALPANLRCGEPLGEPGALEEATPTANAPIGGTNPDGWAPIRRSYAGLPELIPEWVAAHRGALNLVDVRSVEEYDGPDGHIPGSQLIPLPELEARAVEIPADRPTVVLCHSGSRSALATQQLQRVGLRQVANLRGGLRRWKAEGYPVEAVVESSALPQR